MIRRLLSSALLAALAGGCVAVVLCTPSGSPERVAAALLLLLLLPGMAALALLRSGAADHPVGHALLAVGLSLAIVVLASGAVYVVGIRLDERSWAIAVGAITVGLAAGATLRRAPVQPWPRPAISIHRLLPLLAGVVVAAGLLAGATLATVSSVRHRDRDDRFTQLWALPAAGGATAADIGIANHEGASNTYALRVYVNGHLTRTSQVRVGSGQSWTAEQRFAAGARSVRITLTLPGVAQRPYRWVELHFGSS